MNKILLIGFYYFFTICLFADIKQQDSNIPQKINSVDPGSQNKMDQPKEDKKIDKKPSVLKLNFNFPFSQNIPIERNFIDNSEDPFRGILLKPDPSGHVISCLEGKIVAINYMDGYENYIIVSHPNSYYSVYGNLDDVLVAEGQVVSKGVKLGTTIKNKGLYFQLNLGKKPIDPVKFLALK